MVTAHDPNDFGSPRTARHLARFQDAEPTLDAWREILSDRGGRPAEQINVVPHGGFGTVSSSLVSLPVQGGPVWLFAAGAPHEAAFRPVAVGSASGHFGPDQPADGLCGYPAGLQEERAPGSGGDPLAGVVYNGR
jgi:hypothetical protein